MKVLELSNIASSYIGKGSFESIRIAVYAFMALLNLKAEWILILIIFMGLDTVFGIIKALRMKERLSAGVLIWGITIKLCVLCVPFILAALALVLGENLKFVVDIMVRLLIVNEVLSIIANIISIKSKKNVKNLDLISIALNGIRKWLYNMGLKMFQEVIVEPEKKKDEEN